ncbi:ankyrin repeat-containing domain protein [Auriculariales sp. MPI-PUGE-AT-0066]|nr:ankyrin repeat-containing domain protein [Auriculariales sp. MPI-PUGE-AT-0066]
MANTEGATPNERLIGAARADNEDEILEIFDKEQGKYDINFQDGLGNTALHYAAQTGSLAAMEQLLSHDGCDVDLQNRLGRETPLHVALKIESDDLRKEVVESLLDAGADTTVKDKSGRAPIDIVAPDSELWKLMRKAQAEAKMDQEDFASDDDGEPGEASDDD